MSYYALIYETVDDYLARRAEFRDLHLSLAREARERGELLLAGAFDDPVDRALLVFRVDGKSKVEDFARKDPYVVNGLVKKWEVRSWRVVVGEERPPSVMPPGAILRRWSARTTDALVPSYLEHFSSSVLPELRRVAGFLGATISTRHAAGEEAQIFVETAWRSLDAIRAFAGADLEAAVVAPEAAALLTDFDRRVLHSRIALSEGT